MNDADKTLKESFSAATLTEALQKEIQRWRFSHKYVDWAGAVASDQDVKGLLALCDTIVQNQARQDIAAARQEKQQQEIISALEKRLATLEAEFAPQRPLPGKSLLAPEKPPS